MTVADMLERMTMSEFLRWQIFLEKKAMLERGEQRAEDLDGAAFGEAFGVK